MKINNLCKLRHHVLVHNGTDEQNVYGMLTGAVWWLAYEMVEKNNIKDNVL